MSLVPRRPRRWRVVLVGLLVPIFCLGVLPGSASADRSRGAASLYSDAEAKPRSTPMLDDETRRIAKQLQCPICESVSVADSTSELAAQMRSVIRKKLENGETEEQIIAYFVERYGEGVRTEPSRSGFSALVWLAPIVAFVTGLGTLMYVLRAWLPRPRRSREPGAGSREPGGVFRSFFRLSAPGSRLLPLESSAARARALWGSGLVEYALGTLVVLLALAAVVYPLVRPVVGGDAADAAASDGSLTLEARRAAIYREIADMQFDHRLGKLDAADYLEQREKLLARAAELLAEDDRRRLHFDQLVERQIAELRARPEHGEPVGAKAPDRP